MLAHVEQVLAESYIVHRYWQADDHAALLTEAGPRIRGVATDGHAGLALDIMDALPVLEIVSSYGVGYDAIDIPACAARGIHVSNTPDVLNDAVAELTAGMMIALCRHIPQADAYVRQGRWVDGGYRLMSELNGARAGIFGLGRIGKEIARRLSAFRMQVAYHGRHEQPDQPYEYFADLTEMARAVDWLVVIAPASPETAGIISRDVLVALGPQGCLVNVARGSLVDEHALVELLGAGELGGAALDVFADEPNVPVELLVMENVVLSPHQGSATEKTRRAMGDLVLDNLKAHFAGKPLLTPVC